MKRYFCGCALAALVASVSLGAQTPPPAADQPTASKAGLVTVEGCLMREADVPGRKPNVAERAGVTEDYILTSVKVVKGSAPAATTADARPGETPTGTAGAREAMYEVEGIDEAQLKKHSGHRVQIDGTFENTDRAQQPATPTANLVALRGTVLRHVAPECSPK